jgi:hypothetical protein
MQLIPLGSATELEILIKWTELWEEQGNLTLISHLL